MRRRGALAALAMLTVGTPAISGCAARSLPPLPPPIPPRPLHLEPVTDLFPAAGLDWLLTARASELLRALAEPIARVLPPKKLDALATHLGFDVRLADALVIGGYGATTLFALRVAHDGRVTEKQFTERLTDHVERATEGPRVVRVTGMLGTTPRGMADLDETVLLFESGPPGPLKAAVAFAEEKLKRAKPALAAAPLDDLQKRLGDAPLSMVAPRPGRAGWVQGAHGLLSHATAIGGTLTPEGTGLRARGVLLGAWDEPPTEALKRLEATLNDVAGSTLGRLLGLDTPTTPASVAGDREGIRFEAVVDAQKLAEGLWAATSAELGELFGRR